MLLFGGHRLAASTVFWGTFNNDTLYDSTGADLGVGFTFEIGTFTTGFTPTVANMSQWAANWMIFDAAMNGDGWTPGAHFVNTSADHNALAGSNSPDANPLDVFGQGTPAYLWVFNNKAGDNSSEWALLADVDKGSNVFGGAWAFPDPAEQSGQSYDWQTRDLDTAIFGGVNGTQGAGLFTASPVAFTIQTHLVPEPGSALLIAAAGAACMRRRRSSRPTPTTTPQHRRA